MTIRSIALLAFLPLFAKADWLQFRGPNGNGSAETKGLPESLSEKCVAWKQKLPGRGLSSPVVVGDRVYVTASSGPDQKELHVICFQQSDGSIVWERRFRATGRTMCHPKTNVAAPSPASDGRHIFALFSSNDLACFDLDGNLCWLRGLTVDYANASNSLGLASSLVVANGVLVAQVENDADSFTAGISIETGRNLWRESRPKVANWTSPVVFTSPTSGEEVVALQSGHGVSVRRPDDGRELWSYDGGASTIPSSTWAPGKLLVPSHGLTAISLGPENLADQLWRSNQLRPATASPVVSGGKVYVLNNAGVLSCGDMETGERIWRMRLEGPFGGSPVASGDLLYVFSEKGLGQAVLLEEDEGELRGSIDLGEEIQCTPAVSDGALYVRSDGHLWKIATPG